MGLAITGEIDSHRFGECVELAMTFRDMAKRSRHVEIGGGERMVDLMSDCRIEVAMGLRFGEGGDQTTSSCDGLSKQSLVSLERAGEPVLG